MHTQQVLNSGYDIPVESWLGSWMKVYDDDADILGLYTVDGLWKSHHGGESWSHVEDDGIFISTLECDRFIYSCLMGRGLRNGNSWVVHTSSNGEHWEYMYYTRNYRFVKQGSVQDTAFYMCNCDSVFQTRSHFVFQELIGAFNDIVRGIYPDEEDLKIEDFFRLSSNHLLCFAPMNRSSEPGESREYRNYIIVSEDNGENWTVNQNPFPDGEQVTQLIDVPLHPGVLLAVTIPEVEYPAFEPVQYLYRSEDYGNTFTRIDTFACNDPAPLYRNSCGGAVYYSTTKELYASVDDGSSWDTIPVPSVGCSGNILLNQDFLMFSSVDSGMQSWGTAEACSFADEEWYPLHYRALILDENQDVYDTFIEQDGMFYGLWKSVQNDSTDLQVIVSGDHGTTWQFYGERFRTQVDDLVVVNNFADSGRTRFLLTGYSNDLQWTVVYSLENSLWYENPLPGEAKVNNMIQSEQQIIVLSSAGVLVSSNNGQAWERLGNETFETNGVWHNSTTGTVYVDGHYWNGNEWIDNSSPFDNLIRLTGIPGNEPVLFADDGNPERIWISDNDGDSWQSFSFDMPCEYARFQAGPFHDPWRDRVWIATNIGPMFFNVSDLMEIRESHPAHPVECSIMTVYPNPFNGMTRVQMNLTQPGRVVLDLFTVEGRLVQNIDAGYLLPGQHIVPLNAGSLASGTYFLRMEGTGVHQSTEIIIVK